MGDQRRRDNHPGGSGDSGVLQPPATSITNDAAAAADARRNLYDLITIPFPIPKRGSKKHLDAGCVGYRDVDGYSVPYHIGERRPEPDATANERRAADDGDTDASGEGLR